MANATSTPPATSSRSQSLRDGLSDLIKSTGRLIRLLELAVCIFWWLIGVGAVVGTAVLFDHWVWPMPTWLRLCVLIGVVAGSVYWFLKAMLPLLTRPINPAFAARHIEVTMPELKNSLISWWQLSSDTEDNTPRGVLTTVGRHAANHLRDHEPATLVDHSHAIRLGTVFIGMVLLGGLYVTLSPKSSYTTIQRIAQPFASIASPSRVTILEVRPGSTMITQGASLPITAELRGLRRQEEVRIRFETLDGQFTDQIIPMQPVIEGLSYEVTLGSDIEGKATPIFVKHAAGVSSPIHSEFTGLQQPIRYRVEAGDAASEWYDVQVRTVPLVMIERIDYEYPAYMQLKPRSTEGDGRIEAPEGTRVTVSARSNQPMQRARLELNTTIDAKGVVKSSRWEEMLVEDHQLQGSWHLQLDDFNSNPSLQSYRIRATNAAKQENWEPNAYPIKVLADLAPEVQFQSNLPNPLTLPVNEKVIVEIRAKDPDFGLRHMVTRVTLDRRTIDEIVLVNDNKGLSGQVVRQYLMDPAALKLRPKDSVELTVTVKDNREKPGSTDWEPNTTQSPVLTINIVEPVQNPKPDPQLDNNRNQTDSGPSNTTDQENNPSKSNNASNPNNNSTAKQNDDRNAGANQGQGSKSSSADDSSNATGSDGDGQSSNNGGKGNTGNSSNQNSQNPDGNNNSGNTSASNASPQQRGSGHGTSSGNDASEGESGTDNGNGQSGRGARGRGGAANRGGSDSSQDPGEMSNDASDGSAGGRSRSNSARGNSGRPIESSPPDHDGEAIERIQQYMEENGQASSNGNRSARSQSSTGRGSNRNPENNNTQSRGQQDIPSSNDSQSSKDPNSGTSGNAPQNSGAQNSASQPNARPNDGSPNNSAADGQNNNAPNNSSGRQNDATGQSSAAQNNAAQNNPAQNNAAQNNSAQNNPAANTGSQNIGSQSGSSPNGSPQNNSAQNNSAQNNSAQNNSAQNNSAQNNAGRNDPAQNNSSQNAASQNNPNQNGATQNNAAQNSASQNSASQNSASQNSAAQNGAAQNSDAQNGASQNSAPQKTPSQNGSSSNTGAQSPVSPNSNAAESRTGDKSPLDNNAGASNSAANKGTDNNSGSNASTPDNAVKNPSSPTESPSNPSASNDRTQDDAARNDLRPKDATPPDAKPDDAAGGAGQGASNAPNASGRNGQESNETKDPTRDGARSGSPPNNDRAQDRSGANGGNNQSQSGAASSSSSNNAARGTSPSNANAANAGSNNGAMQRDGNAKNSGSDTVDRNNQSPDVADPADIDYAKNATDLVLNYLERQRDQPDPELLKRLSWSEADLKAFHDRWKAARDQAMLNPDRKKQFDETLRSLGLRRPESSRKIQSPDDKLHGLQENGLRVLPPDSVREQFQRFQESMRRGR